MRPPHKQIWELTAEDLETHPVWVFWCEENEGCDEATVTAVDPAEFDCETMYVARARFVTASGVVWPGYVSPEVDLAHSQPLAFTPAGPMDFWGGIAPYEDPARWYAALGMTAAEIFPIRWECEFGLPPCPTAGTIECFEWYDKGGDRKHTK